MPDELFRLFDPRTLISSAIGHVAGNIKTSDPIVGRTIAFLSELQKNIVRQSSELSASTCLVRFRPNRRVGFIECRNPASGTCRVCGGWTCLEHSFIAVNGEMVCRPCAEGMSSVGWSSETGQGGPPPTSVEDVRDHCKELDLDCSDEALAALTAEIVEAARKKLLRDYHPDKTGRLPPDLAKKASQKLQKINASADWLTRWIRDSRSRAA